MELHQLPKQAAELIVLGSLMVPHGECFSLPHPSSLASALGPHGVLDSSCITKAGIIYGFCRRDQ